MAGWTEFWSLILSICEVSLATGRRLLLLALLLRDRRVFAGNSFNYLHKMRKRSDSQLPFKLRVFVVAHNAL